MLNQCVILCLYGDALCSITVARADQHLCCKTNKTIIIALNGFVRFSLVWYGDMVMHAGIMQICSL